MASPRDNPVPRELRGHQDAVDAMPHRTVSSEYGARRPRQAKLKAVMDKLERLEEFNEANDKKMQLQRDVEECAARLEGEEAQGGRR